MTRALALFEVLVGLAYGFAVFVFLTSMFGISTPIWGIQFLLYWGSMFAGPLLLLVGGLLILISVAPKLGSILVIFGGAALTCWVLYFLYGIADETVRQGTDKGMIMIGAVTFLVVLAADVAAYKIGKAAGVLR